jgi:hypothetical protein
MRDGKVELKGLDLALFLVIVIHLHLMEGDMVLLLLNPMVGDIPKKMIKKKKVVILNLMKQILLYMILIKI